MNEGRDINRANEDGEVIEPPTIDSPVTPEPEPISPTPSPSPSPAPTATETERETEENKTDNKTQHICPICGKPINFDY